MSKLVDITGATFGAWRVLRRGPAIERGGHAKWWCACACGTERLVPGRAMRNGQSRSCGCTRTYDHNSYADGDVMEFVARFNSYAEKAKRRGIPFELTLLEFVVVATKPCNYCGVAPAMPIRRHRVRRQTGLMNGVDRQDNAQGYVVANVVPCCTACNEMKLDRTVAQFVTHAKRIAAHNS